MDELRNGIWRILKIQRFKFKFHEFNLALHPKLREHHVDRWRKHLGQNQCWLQAQISGMQYCKLPKLQEKNIIQTLLIQARQQGKRLKMQPVETVVVLSLASPACQTCGL